MIWEQGVGGSNLTGIFGKGNQALPNPDSFLFLQEMSFEGGHNFFGAVYELGGLMRF